MPAAACGGCRAKRASWHAVSLFRILRRHPCALELAMATLIGSTYLASLSCLM
jgi:hypothetical protein